MKNKTELQKQEIKGLKKHLEQLKVDLQEANDNITWWTNRFKVVERKSEKLTNNWNELEEFIKNHYIVGHTIQNASLQDISRKMKEIKEIYK